MKLTTLIAIATTFLLFGATGYAQTRASGSPAARQDVGDPLIRKPTSEQLKRSPGITTGSSMRNTNGSRSRERIGGPPESQQSGGASAGG
jgi:hypothetical protein